MQSQHRFNDCIAEAAGMSRVGRIFRVPRFHFWRGCLVAQEAPSSLVGTPIEGSAQARKKQNGDIKTRETTSNGRRGPAAHSIWIVGKNGLNVLPSSERGEGSASHRTASSSEVPRHT